MDEEQNLPTGGDVDPERSAGDDGLDLCSDDSAVIEQPDVPIPQAVYDRALLDAQLSISQDVSLKLPWESGVFGAIFGDEMLALPSTIPVLPQPAIPGAATEMSEQLARSSHVAASAKRSADVGFHAAVMTDIADVDALLEASQLLDTAISKWQFIFETTEWSGLIGVRLFNIIQDEGSVEDCRAVIRDVLGIKSPRTAIKRADSLRKYFNWVMSRECAPWPILSPF